MRLPEYPFYLIPDLTVPFLQDLAVGEPRQPLELGLAVDLELALENMARGRTAQALVSLIHSGQQRDVRRRVVALKTRPRGGLGRDPPELDIVADQSRGLCPTEASHALDVGPQQPFGAPLLKRVFVMAEQTLHPGVNLRATATGKPHTLRGRKKCLDLNQTQLLCSKHADHPSSACPLQRLQAHLALESTPPFRLILRWTRVALDLALWD